MHRNSYQWVFYALIGISIVWLIKLYPYVGGVDFYCYLLTARDILLDPEFSSFDRYFYFPGVYQYWKSIVVLTGLKIELIQISYIMITTASMWLVYQIVKNRTNDKRIGSISVLLFLYLLLKSEWAEACSELILVFAFLLSCVLVDLIKNIKYEFVFIFILGVLGAFIVFIKQQGLFLVPALYFYSVTRLTVRRFFGTGIVFLLSFAMTIILLFIAEGGGIPALIKGLNSARIYESQNSFFENAFGYLFQIRFMFILILSVCMIGFICMKRGIVRFQDLDWKMIFISSLAIVAPLYQFKYRGYYHYGILILPGLILLSASVANWWYTKLSTKVQNFVFLTSILAIFICCSNFFYKVEARGQTYLTQRGEILSDICPLIVGNRLLLVPSRENIVFWICNKRAGTPSLGYGWPERSADSYASYLSQKDLRSVLIVPEGVGGYGSTVLSSTEWRVFFNKLSALGFVYRKTAFGDLYLR